MPTYTTVNLLLHEFNYMLYYSNGTYDSSCFPNHIYYVNLQIHNYYKFITRNYNPKVIPSELPLGNANTPLRLRHLLAFTCGGYKHNALSHCLVK